MIYKRGNVYWTKFKRQGEQVCKSLKTSDRHEAELREIAIKAEYDQALDAGLLSAPVISIVEKSLDELEPVAKSMLAGMRHRAKKKGILCTLEKGDVLGLLTASQGECAVTGVPLDIDTKINGGRVSPWMPSIDRIDSRKGYVSGNCRIVCYQANLAMSQFGEAALELMLHYYAKRKFKKSGKRQVFSRKAA